MSVEVQGHEGVLSGCVSVRVEKVDEVSLKKGAEQQQGLSVKEREAEGGAEVSRAGRVRSLR